MILRALPSIGRPDVAKAVSLALHFMDDLDHEHNNESESSLVSEKQQGPIGCEHRCATPATAGTCH